MVQELPRRTSVSGPALIRLLARLTNADVSESRQSIPDRLSLWLGWTDAIALAGVLNGPAVAAPVAAGDVSDAWEGEYARVRSSLEKAIDGHTASGPDRQRGHSAVAVQGDAQATTVAFSTYRRRYSALQQTMETSIATLRSRLRTMLAARSPDMSRLASLDAAMEQALSDRELTLLAGVPALLEGHFERLRQTAEPEGQPLPTVSSDTPNAWLDVFHKNMKSVMLAELDIRLQPVEGLLRALRAG
jgi:hypothetical protein